MGDVGYLQQLCHEICTDNMTNSKVDSILNSVTPEKRYKLLTLLNCLDLTALSAVAMSEHTERVKIILRSVTAEQRYNILMLQSGVEDCTPIGYATGLGRTATVKAILDSVTPEQRYNMLMLSLRYTGRTAIVIAGCAGFTETVKAMLDSVTSEQRYNMLILQSPNGTTAISVVADHGHAESVQLMLDSVDSDTRYKMLKMQNINGCTALHHSASRGHINTFRSIIASLSTEHREALLAVRDRNGQLAVELQEKPPSTQEAIVPSSADVTAVDKNLSVKLRDSQNSAAQGHLNNPPREKESSRRDEKASVPANPNQRIVKGANGVPPNYIQKVEQLECFKEEVVHRRVDIQKKETSVTEEIKELRIKLTAIVEEKENAIEVRNEWNYKCNKLEIELNESKQELKRKDALIYSLGSTTKAQADSNLRLQELLSDKKWIEDDRERVRAELDVARAQLDECEEKLQELQNKEQVTTQEQEHLERKLEKYKLVVRRLEKKEVELEEQFQKYQIEKENILKSWTIDRSVRGPVPRVTTIAEQAEPCGEQEGDSFSDDDAMTTYRECPENNLADADTETGADKKEIKAESSSNVCTQEMTKEKEINTRYGREIKAAYDEVDMLRAEEEIFAKAIAKMVADAETDIADKKEVIAEPTNNVFFQERAKDIEINTPYDKGLEEYKNSVLIQKIKDLQTKLAKTETKNAELEAKIAEHEDKIAQLKARNTELESMK